MGFKNKNITEFDCKGLDRDDGNGIICNSWCRKNICKKHLLPEIGTIKKQLSNYDLSIGKWQMVYSEDCGHIVYGLKLLEYL